MKPGIPAIIVANKADLLSSTAAITIQLPGGADLVQVSAKEKQHIDELQQLIYQRTVKGQLSADETLITNIRHLEALQKTEQALVQVLNGMATDVTSDLLAMDIKQALHYLGEITGVVTTDDLLDNIFSKFCIGK